MLKKIKVRPSRKPLYIAMLFAIASAASAQEATTEKPAEPTTETAATTAHAADSEKVLDSVKVTAQGREQELKDVPIAINVIDNTVIEQLAATDMGDLDGFVPGLEITSSSPTQPRYQIRGISTGDFGVGTDPAVGVYIDGVYAARSGGALLAFNDVERIEVLKGPQGTLFGRNTAAGAISIITKKPGMDQEGNLTFRIGNDGQQYIYGLYNLPVTESSAMRMSFVSNESDGWLKDDATGQDYGGQSNWATKLAWRTKFGSGTILDLSWDHEETDQLARPVIGVVPLPPAGYGLGSIAQFPADPTTYIDPRNAPVYNDVVNNNESRKFDGVTLQLYHGFEWAGMTFSAAYRGFTTNNREDEDGTNRINLYLDTDNIEENSSFYTELKFNGIAGSVDWIAGVSWYDESANQTSQVNTFTDTLDTIYFNGSGGQFPPFTLLQGTLSSTPGLTNISVFGESWRESMINTGQFNSTAAFGDAIWHVNDKLNLTFGLRYTYDQKTFSWFNGAYEADSYNATLAFLNQVGFLPQFYAGLDSIDPSLKYYYTTDLVWNYSAEVEGNKITSKNSWSNFSPRFVVDYAINDDMMVWGSYTQGYKAGGYNSVEINSKFDNEDVTNYEAGLKWDIKDWKLSINTSLFYYVYNGKQSIRLDTTTSSGIPQYVVSTSDDEATGWDMQAYWRPIDGLTFNFSSQYIDQTYKSFIAEDGSDLSGQATGIPKWSLAFGGNYAWLFSSGAQLEFSLMHSYRGASRCNDSSTAQGNCQVTPNFEIGVSENRTDGRIQWSSSDDHWGVGAYVKNIFDNQYIGGVGGLTASLLGTPHSSISEPIQYGLEFKFKF